MLSARTIADLLRRDRPTDEQAAVIEGDLGPALVVAGAGSGKTETMAGRVVWLLANGLVAPGNCLWNAATCFDADCSVVTSGAKNEMYEPSTLNFDESNVPSEPNATAFFPLAWSCCAKSWACDASWNGR